MQGLILAALMAFQAQPAQEQVRPTYTLGPDDQLYIRALDVEEFGKEPVKIDARGNISLPLVGRLKASGLTVEQIEALIADRLKQYVKEPHVTVSVVEMRSQPVSVLGAVNQPGVHFLQGRKTLFEMISLAGGLKPEAGYRVKITRRLEWGRIPLPTAKDDPTGEFNVAEVRVTDIMKAENPEQNILIKPHDVITVPKADLVYVIGAVRRSGGFVLGEKEKISALQALSLAEGLDQFASARSARVLRRVPGSADRTEIGLDVKKILDGKAPDYPLQAEDILFIPTSTGRKALVRSIDAAIQVGTGLAIYGPLYR